MQPVILFIFAIYLIIVLNDLLIIYFNVGVFNISHLRITKCVYKYDKIFNIHTNRNYYICVLKNHEYVAMLLLTPVVNLIFFLKYLINIYKNGYKN